MTCPIVIPESPSNRASPASDDSSTQPRTPISPEHQDIQLESTDSTNNNSNNSTNSATTATKRKPSRRANTAERRATHNAVERQRRETLNGRFLDLASLLPNLSQIRRPSKSSIVNSSIAHIHASRRHRLLAARELRLLKLEADALRRELNEWRDRAGIPRIEEPVRGDGFGMVLSGELEIIPVVAMGGMDEEDADFPYGDDAEDDVYNRSNNSIAEDGLDDHRVAAIIKSQQQPVAPSMSHAAALSINTNIHHPMMQQPHHPSGIHPMDRHHIISAGPMIASPTGMSFDNPAMGNMYDNGMNTAAAMYSGAYVHHHGGLPDVQDKWSAGGYPTPGNPHDQAFLASLARRTSGNRARSASMSGSSSGSASPPHSQYYEHGHGHGWSGNSPAAAGAPNAGNGMMSAPGMGMVGGGGGMGNGVAFAMMM